MTTTLIGIAMLSVAAPATAQSTVQIPQIKGRTVLLDTDGQPVNAHGAGVLLYKGVYYLYGEVKKGSTRLVPGQNWEDYRVAAGGISCYSSRDLKKWKNMGIVLKVSVGRPEHDLDTGRVIERPKVIYNEKTRKFVMWMHVDKNDYNSSRAGVALSDLPWGPFDYQGSVAPNGQMLRDMNLFKDTDGKAYLIYSSEENNTMHVCLLNEDYLRPTKIYSRIFENKRRESPAVFKHGQKYFMITSGCTGWSPNAAAYAVADNILGPWTELGNPCKGKDGDKTFFSQATFVLPVKGHVGEFIFMADRWNKMDLEKSGYLWLPLHIANNKIEIFNTNPDL